MKTIRGTRCSWPKSRNAFGLCDKACSKLFSSLTVWAFPDAGAVLQLAAQEHSRDNPPADNHQGLQLFALLWGRATWAREKSVGRARPYIILRWACFRNEEAELRCSG